LVVESIKLSLTCPEDVGKLPTLVKYCVCFLSCFLFLLSRDTSLLHLLGSSLVVASCAQQQLPIMSFCKHSELSIYPLCFLISTKDSSTDCSLLKPANQLLVVIVAFCYLLLVLTHDHKHFEKMEKSTVCDSFG